MCVYIYIHIQRACRIIGITWRLYWEVVGFRVEGVGFGLKGFERLLCDCSWDFSSGL